MMAQGRGTKNLNISGRLGDTGGGRERESLAGKIHLCAPKGKDLLNWKHLRAKASALQQPSGGPLGGTANTTPRLPNWWPQVAGELNSEVREAAIWAGGGCLKAEWRGASLGRDETAPWRWPYPVAEVPGASGRAKRPVRVPGPDARPEPGKQKIELPETAWNL